MLRPLLSRGLQNYVQTNPLILGTTTRGIIKCNNKVAEYLNDVKQEYKKQLEYQATIKELPMSEPKKNWYDASKIYNLLTGFRFSFDIKKMLYGAGVNAKDQKVSETDVPEEKLRETKK